MILINSSPKNALRIFQPFLPISVPIGIGFLYSALEKEGIRSVIIDEQVEDDALDAVERVLPAEERPYVFGFSVLTVALKSALGLAANLKERYPDSITVFGGIHPTAVPDEVLAYPQVDFVIRGEGEVPLAELYRALKTKGGLAEIKGLSYKENGSARHNGPAPILLDLDSMPPFPYHAFKSKKYDLGFIVSSRGCPHKCIFCSNRVTTGLRYRIRSHETIIEELAMLYEKYGRKDILFLDDNLLVSRKRIYALMEGLRQRGLDKKMTFSFQARGDNVDRKLLEDLYAAGFRSVFFGLETASEEVMKTVKKGETVAQCVEAVRMAKEIGFHVSATFIFALPGETHDDRIRAADMSVELGLDMVRFNNATPYPGTELYETAKAQGRLNIYGLYENLLSVSSFIENPFNKIPFSYVPDGNTEDEIRRDILWSYFRYYLDFRKLKAVFTRPDLGSRWFSAGESLREFLSKAPALLFLGLMMFTKVGQLFYLSVLKPETRISPRFFFGAFRGLFPGDARPERK